MAERINMLFGVNTPVGLRNIVLDGASDPPPQKGGAKVGEYFWDLSHISGMAEARDLKFCTHCEP